MDSVARAGYSYDQRIGVSRIIDGYTPNSIDRWVWEGVRQTVIDIVRAFEPISEDDALAALRSVTRLTIWCHFDRGYELDSTLILHDVSIERFIAMTMPSSPAPTQRREAQRLLAIAAGVHRTRQIPSIKAMKLARSSIYSSKEQVAIVGWAQTQNSERVRRNADLVVALTLGAGLYPAELLAARVGNVAELGDLLIVNVGGDNPRQVPIRRFWADIVRERIVGRPSDEQLMIHEKQPDSTTSVMTLFVGTSRAGRPDPQKMRSTWIVGLLNDRVPVPIVLKAAGLKHSDSLNRYLPFVDEPANSDALLAGAEAEL
jgi:hypothetical protein